MQSLNFMIDSLKYFCMYRHLKKKNWSVIFTDKFVSCKLTVFNINQRLKSSKLQIVNYSLPLILACYQHPKRHECNIPKKRWTSARTLVPLISLIYRNCGDPYVSQSNQLEAEVLFSFHRFLSNFSNLWVAYDTDQGTRLGTRLNN